MNIPLAVYQAINLLNAVLSLLIGAFVLLTRKRSRVIVLFGIFAFLVFFWDIFFFGAFQTDDFVLSRYLFRTCMIAGALILPVFTEFVFSLAGKNIPPAYRLVNFGIAALIISSIYTDLYAYDGGPFLVFHYWPIIGLMSAVQIVHYAVNVFFSHRELIRMSMFADGRLKQQARIIVVGTSLGYLGAASNFLLWFRIPFPPILNILIPVYVASAAYAITKHRLMNISVVISRALAWTLAAGAFGGVYAALAAAYRAFVSPAIDPAFTAWTVAYCLWCGVYFSRCRLFLQTTTDRAFVKGAYDYRLVQRKLFAELRRAGTLQDAVGIVSGIIDRELDISGARIILPDDPAFDRLKEIGEIVGREERPDLPARLAVPCRVGDKPVALILLEQKRSEEPFDEQDGDMLKTIAEELADTLVRTRPYERVREELSAARAQLDRAQRLAALGTVAAGVAHEIRNPLGVIQLKTARLAPETAANPAALAAYQSEIEQLIGRITDIVRGMLSLSRGETKPREKVDLNEVIDATLGYFNGGAVRVVRENAGPPPVLADREELKQVFINLFDNACRAMPEGGELRVKTCQAGPDAVVEIADAGKGIAAGDLEKIFDPFFSTGGEGAGLGLAIVYRIVREHGGEIGVRSEVGRGTVFTLRFPPAA